MKEFPRLYSLSTLGLIHHQDFNYRFHPLRTDFIGDSGTGKSMISDLLQLIFVGSAAFESATKGTDERKPAGMVLQSTGRGTDMGYAFLNIEVKQSQFIGLGVYIESTGSHTEAFIVQKGYNFEELTPFAKPLETKNFSKNEEILPLDVLKEHLENEGLVCESWQRLRSYHEILYNNNILPLNLAENDKTLKDFAQIIQSFSRGKTLEINKSSSLKDFLFGDNEAKRIHKKFKEAVKDFESEMGEYGRNRGEIDRVIRKQKDYSELKEKKDKRDKTQRTWLKQDLLYKYQNRNALLEKLKESISDYHQANQYLLLVENWAISENDKINEASQGTAGQLDQAKKAFEKRIPDHSLLEKAQNLLVKLNCTAESLQKHYEQNRALHHQNHIINSVHNSLTAKGLQIYYKENQWPEAYKEFAIAIQTKREKLTAELQLKNTLKGYANLTNPESLGYWALRQERELSPEEESALVHFQKLPRAKPVDRGQFLPSPEEFIQALSIIDQEEDGFWLNLNGIREFVHYTPQRIFDTTDKEKIRAYFNAFSDKLDSEIETLQQETEQLKNLQNLFEERENPKKEYETYRQPDPELPEREIEDLNLSQKEFEKLLHCLKDDKRITEEYKQAYKDYQQALTDNEWREKKQKSLKAILELLTNPTKTSTQPNERWNDNGDTTAQLNEILEEHNPEPETVTFYDFDSEETETISSKIANHQQKVDTCQLVDLSNRFKESDKELKDAKTDWLKFSDQLPDIEEGEYHYVQEPKKEKEAFIAAETDYQAHYNHIISTYLMGDQYKFGGNFDFLELGENLLPEALRGLAVTEQNVIDQVQHYLNEINEKNRQITSRKIQKIKSIVDEVDAAVGEQLDIARRIDNFFTSIAEDIERISGGYKVKLNRDLSTNYPKDWINTFKNDVDNQTSLFSDNSSKDLINELALERSLEEVMTKAFYNCGGSKTVKVDTPRLLDPASYYDLTFSMKSATGRTNIGSTGQTYAAISLLCIARLSVIGRKEKEGQKTGLRFMPIDEAEGLGSNFDLLYDIAEEYDYQIISMSVGSVGRFRDGAQYVYILHKNTDQDDPVNFPPMAIWSQADINHE
ncbi:hypothetical protein [Roseivirga pacifica]|uniref:hypothetical protein n=1 Tax=Roseivirga pacifica TaxID=1267423 RepID=UPI0020960958|nr:hypothetical protein [Roseivirga pacifica]MCO6359145.1 hypothetical protein [Roseivirga pacifica]MCO6365219.1 hypothetical protein [Roseivirga pacifica]MCO6372051.1 hypothetical protein [Roseivirga pacifica]MCO6375838.1 hypothetical protein [Roseivirga pacifica]MCO6379429.1 hypothetical protein [Roseivirga pacifica]